MFNLSTLCYIERDNSYLMLHRTVKKDDINKDKWIGVGGHFETGESPEECLLREVKEETGYILNSYKYRGIVTFVYGENVTEYMSLFTADGFTGEQIPCDEGQLEWIKKTEIGKLNLWEGDKIFFRLLEENRAFFSLKLVYDEHDVLRYAALDGEIIELSKRRGGAAND
jgi:8-oxo-dGTP pyrophosphatase MutT (NUDIX family)